MSRTQDENRPPEQQHSIDEATLESHNSQMLDSAQEFQAHIEQLSSWKLQLASQMDVLRRDGVKLLEKQKRLADQKLALNQERDTVAREKSDVEAARKELAEKQETITRQQAELDARAAQIEDAGSKLQSLLEEKERYLAAVAESKSTLETLRVEQIKAGENLQGLTRAADEARTVAAEKDQWLAQIKEAKETLAELVATQQEIASQQQQFKQQLAELNAREAALLVQEQTLVEKQTQVSAAHGALEEQRRTLAEQERTVQDKSAEFETRAAELARQADDLAKRAASADKTIKDHDRKQAELAAKFRQVTEAEARLAETRREVAEAEAKLAADRTWVSDAHSTLSKLQEQLAARAMDVHKQSEAAGRRQDAARQGNEQVQKLQIEVAAKEEQIQALEAALRAREEEHAAAPDTSAVDALQIELTAQRRLVQQEAAELRQLEAALAEQKLAVAEQEEKAGAALAKAEALDREVEEKQGQLREAENALQQRERQIEQSFAALQESQARIEQSERDLQAKASAMTTTAAQGQSDVELKKQFEAEKTALSDRALQLQLQLTELAASRASLELQVIELTSKLESAADDAEEVLQRRLADQKNVYEQFVTTKQTQVAELQKQLRTQQSKYDEERAALEESYKQTIAGLQQAQASVQSQPALAVSDDAAKLTAALHALEQRYTELKADRDTVRTQYEDMSRSAQDALLSSNALQSRIQELQRNIDQLQAEKGRLAEVRGRQTDQPVNVDADKLRAIAARLDRQRNLLFNQVKRHRQRLWGVRERQRTIDHHWESIAKERSDLVHKKTALEQIKRLLEKQELVMARKLADHSAVKTVAALGIFVIMILGSSFAGVYQFISPVYRSEAVVKLSPPPEAKANELGIWMSRQVELVRSPDILNTAWGTLRNTDGYNVHESKDAFVASLPAHLTLALDGKNMLIQYTGPTADGVAQVCNALGGAYAGHIVDTTFSGAEPLAKAQAALGMLTAKATPSLKPLEDRRMMMALSIAAAALFISLLAVMIMRHFIYRQLREIDQMADDEDLESLNGDMPVEGAV